MLSEAEVRQIVRHLDVPGFRIYSQSGTYVDVIKLNVMNSYRRNPDGSFTTPNGGTGELRSHAKKRWIGGWRDEADLISSIFATCQMLNDHELREFFFYKTMRPFDPHKPQSRTSRAEEHYEQHHAAVLHRPDIPPANQWYDRTPYVMPYPDTPVDRYRVLQDIQTRARLRNVDLSES